MAANVIVDAGFLVALLSRRDSNHQWAAYQAAEHAVPWHTCEAVLSEAFHLLGDAGAYALSEVVLRGAVVCGFNLADHMERVLTLHKKYASVPMSLADACLVRMSETLAEPLILTTDSDFRIYRRHSRQVIPCVLPAKVRGSR